MIQITPEILIPLYKKHHKGACTGTMKNCDETCYCPMGILAIDSGMLSEDIDDAYGYFEKQFGYKKGPMDFYLGFDSNRDFDDSVENVEVFRMGRRCREVLIAEGLLKNW